MPNFNYNCPTIPYLYKEGNKHVIAYNVVYPSVPTTNFKYLKVLPGGRQVAFLIATPRFFAIDRGQMGDLFSETSARNQACS